jgi:DNA-directed RNA polymerase specialized sigma24 family protein
MTTEQRNSIYTENQNLIDITIRRNRRLIAALGLDIEDVAQDLSIKMLSAIEKFDPARSESLEAHIICQLQYAILDMRRQHKPHGMSGVRQGSCPEYVYIDKTSDNGAVFEIASHDDASIIEFAEVVASLSDSECEALKNKMAGHKPRKKQQTAALASVRDRFASYYNDEVYERRACA